jgi:hypothetical protein
MLTSWSTLGHTVLTDKCKQVCRTQLDEWYNGVCVVKYSAMISAWRAYLTTQKKPWSYDGLNEHVADNTDMDWEEVHAFRANIVFLVRSVIAAIHKKKYANVATNEQITESGSNLRNSDVDIAISKCKSATALLMLYMFGLISHRLVDDGSIDGMSTDAVIGGALTGICAFLDIAVYTSSGVIANCCYTAEGLGKRTLATIGKNQCRVLHSPVPGCELQRQIFKFVVCLLMDRIYLDGLSEKFKDCRQKTKTAFLNDATVKAWYEDAKNIALMDPLSKFKNQLHASMTGDVYAEEIRLGEGDVCESIAQWEKNQIIANLSSPESAISTQSFVFVVLDTQEGNPIAYMSNSQDYWVAFIEDLGNLTKQLQLGDARRAYKYALRTALALNAAATGDIEGIRATTECPAWGDIEPLQYDKVREDKKGELTDSILARLSEVAKVWTELAFRTAPPTVMAFAGCL